MKTKGEGDRVTDMIHTDLAHGDEQMVRWQTGFPFASMVALMVASTCLFANPVLAQKKPTDSKKAAPVSQPAARAASQPAARPLAQPTRRAPVRARVVAPQPRLSPKKADKSKEQTTTYDMIFRGKTVGSYVRSERTQKDGSIVVNNKSKLTVRMLFAKVTAVNSSRCVYSKEGRLQSFTITSTVRGKTTRYTGKQDTDKIVIEKQEGKSRIKRIFSVTQYQATSLDLRFPTAQSGVKYIRKYLIIPRMRIISQTISFRSSPASKVFGKRQALLEMMISNRRGSGILLLTKDGKMVASKMSGRLGRVEIRINKGT